jgi:hypothetical protein
MKPLRHITSIPPNRDSADLQSDSTSAEYRGVAGCETPPAVALKREHEPKPAPPKKKSLARMGSHKATNARRTLPRVAATTGPGLHTRADRGAVYG